jgi:hypothetical protein
MNKQDVRAMTEALLKAAGTRKIKAISIYPIGGRIVFAKRIGERDLGNGFTASAHNDELTIPWSEIEAVA